MTATGHQPETVIWIFGFAQDLLPVRSYSAAQTEVKTISPIPFSFLIEIFTIFCCVLTIWLLISFPAGLLPPCGLIRSPLASVSW